MIPLEPFTPELNPLGQQWLSAIVGLIPIVTMMVTLAGVPQLVGISGVFGGS